MTLFTWGGSRGDGGGTIDLFDCLDNADFVLTRRNLVSALLWEVQSGYSC